MSQRPGPAVRRATAADVPALAGTLARAFRDDPVFRWLFPLGHSREARNAAFFEVELRHLHLRHNEVWTADEGASAALWDPPGRWKVPLTTLARVGPSLIRLLGARTPIGLLGLNRVEARHPPTPHWYLAILGTDPDRQGRGLASAALAPVLARCDAEGTPTGSRSGGKALRPALTLLSARAAGAPAERAVPAAVAVELVHNFYLLHDDIMDGDTERRHRPTAWTVHGVGAAILAGDALLALAQDILLEDTAAQGLWAARCLSAAVLRLIAGQGADLAFEQRNDVNLPECLTMAGDKTAALMACACSIGAIHVGAPPARGSTCTIGHARHGPAFGGGRDQLRGGGSPLFRRPRGRRWRAR